MEATGNASWGNTGRAGDESQQGKKSQEKDSIAEQEEVFPEFSYSGGFPLGNAAFFVSALRLFGRLFGHFSERTQDM